jgi:hypothetical protein
MDVEDKPSISISFIVVHQKKWAAVQDEKTEQFIRR